MQEVFGLFARRCAGFISIGIVLSGCSVLDNIFSPESQRTAGEAAPVVEQSPIIANRFAQKYSEDHHLAVDRLIEHVLQRSTMDC